ncbi:flagellar basal-body MS-ring/collar protein FliF [Listeria ivanovii]|uniref:flagellar basal-body MS-ring/collar protein FliF n=1 Tax=Listeria ivanovii TaxID=1638 RepID=UPI00051284CE|nr:flagellar basal-body MS-ring/collar protein FliF [Listeria ivanovii]AIS61974.1 flagellar M-ring protein FliF [Listeria ivanovii subsp. londoniensis]MBK1965662.1 flagellar M-ring protein FliF [Listeria ivanovii subsp. londoniensis]MBK1983488.1 flagellar M-ring protein FliF [Listeria ivanovii subsp. londoniensis]MBK1994830.1 flagellar M-ring protein FliF [Listeria ivanovii subsp. londoniensis]MBK2002413.1 flagellar M-ring protein FliF [Listeria ivanovii subsp. londoniensis]
MAKIKTMYSKLKNWHKGAIFVGLFVVVTVFLLYLNTPKTEITLYKNLSETSQQQVTDQLAKMGVDYTVDKSGNILVDEKVETLVRDKFADLGIPYTGQDGNDILLNSSLGASEEDKKMQEKVGTKVNLEKEIVQSYGTTVDSASVQLTLPESSSIFEEASQKGSAAVTLKTKNNQTLTSEQVLGIQRTVSAAVPNVASEDVAIIDTKNGVISEADTSKEEGSSAYKNEVDIQNAIGKNVKTDIEGTLSSIFALDNFRVNTSVTVNFDEIKQNTERYPNDGKVRSNQKDTSTDTSKGSTNTTESGTAANADVPNYTEENGGDTNTYTSEKSSETTNYELDSTIQEIKKHPALAKTNVVVWVDQQALNNNGVDMAEFTKAVGVSAGLTPNMATPEGAEEGATPTFEGTFQNGDVTIMPIQFLDNQTPVEKDAGKTPEPASKAWIWWLAGGLLFAIIAAGIIGYIIFLKRKEQLEEALEPEEVDYIPAEEAIVMPEDHPDFNFQTDAFHLSEPELKARKESLKNKLGEMAKEDPGRAAAVIQKWLNERQE